MTSCDNTQPTVAALQDQDSPNASELENPNFIDFATEQQFTEWLNQQYQQAGPLSDSPMGTFDGETWTPIEATTASEQTDSGVNSQSEAPGLFSIKAGVCMHHIYHSEQLPWSGTELDFDRRYCDACLARQGLAGGIAAIDLNADLSCQGVADGVADIDLNGDFSFLHGCNLGVESTAEVAFMGQVSSVTEAIGEDPSHSFPAFHSLMGPMGQDPLACEAMQGMPFDPLIEPVPLMAYTDHCSSMGEVTPAYPSFEYPAQQMFPDQESDIDNEQFRISWAEGCEPATQLSLFESQSDNIEDRVHATSEYEDEEMEDAFYEPPSPEIGVSFSPEHIWPGEDIAREEPGYSSDYRLLDEDEEE